MSSSVSGISVFSAHAHVRTKLTLLQKRWPRRNLCLEGTIISMKKRYVIGDSISIQYGPYLQRTLPGVQDYARKEGETVLASDDQHARKAGKLCPKPLPHRCNTSANLRPVQTIG